MDLPKWLDRASPGMLAVFLGKTASPRKAGLFARHLCRCFPGVFADPRSLAALDAADGYEAGEVGEPAYRAAVQAAEEALAQAQAEYHRPAAGGSSPSGAACAALIAANVAREVAARGYYPRLLAELRPIAGTSNSRHSTARKRLPRATRRVFAEIFGDIHRPVALDPSWLTPTAVALAESIYADRAFDRLPILADALEDAGCDSAALLAHLRGDGLHVRGCWAVDLVLGKG